MANIKISELTALTPPDAADLVPVTDASASQTKRTTVGEIVGIINGDVDVADDGTATISELPVSKLQDGAARQLLQTDAAGTGVEWTSNVDVPGTLDVTSTTTLDAALNVAGLASLDGGIDVDGAFTVANTSGNVATSGTLDVDGEATLASAIVEDLTSNRVLIAGTGGAVEDDANLTFNGTTFDVGSGNLQVTAANGNTSIAGTLGVTGQSTLASAAVSDLTSGRVVLAGTSGELEDNAALTFNGTQFLVGTPSARGIGSSANALIQTETTSYAVFSGVQASNDTGGATLILGKTRGTAVGSSTSVQSGDNCGALLFAGADGTDIQTPAASITATVDGTPGANDMPGRLVFSTTADGASSPTERMRIKANGSVCIGTTTEGTLSGDTVVAIGPNIGIISKRMADVATNGTVDISINTGGGGYQGFLIVSNTKQAGANARTHATYSVFGRGTDSSIQQIASDNGTDGAMTFTVTTPTNGVIRVTNTAADTCTVIIQFFGGTSF